MARVTFTIDDESAREVDLVRAQIKALRSKLVGAIEREPAAESPLLHHLLASLETLDDHASASAILRGAVTTYLGALREVEQAATLDEGYAALATEEERSAILRGAAGRVSARWADEP